MNDIEFEDTYKKVTPWNWVPIIGATLLISLGATLVLGIIGLAGFWNSSKVEEKKPYSYTSCKTAKTWQMIDWNIECQDGYSYQRIEPPTFDEKEEEKKQEEEQKKKDEAYSEALQAKFESDRNQWLVDHPPVKELFDPEKRDLEYTISYIRKNWYHGDCALAWHQQILCWDVGGRKLVFPTSRDE